ncbi:pilus assembly protein [Thioalkalivibrio sp. HL-Eb18]|uniref:pilus assembly protein n=1 Tax=Thioalkalivibrio sp. HL-Eb18 TaxID=1266913 RepID=UPI0003698B67|nr:PilC/PilY family type IV pilus protein [Thioalkalivibrio sp. HL-Eb18]
MATHRSSKNPPPTPRLSRRKVAIAVAAAMMSFSGTAHGINLANTPLFLQDSALPPNILFIPDTSESMQEGLDGRVAADWNNPSCIPGDDVDADNCVSGAAHPDSKGSIVKQVGMQLVNSYRGQVNLGLLSYQQNPAGHVRDNVFESTTPNETVLWRLAHRAGDVRYANNPNPPFYDADFTGDLRSDTKRFREPHPQLDGWYIFYNFAIPGYIRDSSGDWPLDPDRDDFTSFFHDFPNDQTTSGGFTFPFRQFETARLPGQTGSHTDPDSQKRYNDQVSSFWRITITDSMRNRGLPEEADWGERISYAPTGQSEWRTNTSPGLGFLHVPIGGFDADGNVDQDHWDAVVSKLQPQRHDWDIGDGNVLVDPDWPLINAGLTPLEGTMQTARDYFLDFAHPEERGNMTGVSGPNFGNNQGRNNAQQIPRSCDINAAIWVTDGMPSVAADGTGLGDDLPQALEDAAASIAAFYNDTGVEVHVVGFGLPPGVSDIPGIPEDPLDILAEAGGTGSAYDATDEASLDAAMTQIFETIIAQATGSASSVAAASTSFQPDGTNLLFQASFNSNDWSGDVTAFDFIFGQGTFTQQWSAASMLPSAAQRNIFSHDGNEGIRFTWESVGGDQGLSDTQKGLLNDDPDLLAYLRGDQSNEIQNGGDLRNRSTPLGDFVNSNPAFQGPALNFGYSQLSGYSQFRADNQDVPEVVYVGGNAGMLHAFDAQTGEELFAYVPNAIFDKLPDLADPDYSHRFFVDGQQTIAHAQIGGDWRTVLIGTLGAGARGIYALDVTDPTDFSADNILWELTGDDLDALGYTFGAPTVARTANGQWSVLFANGYGSNDDEAVLMIANLASGAMTEVETGATGGNGLSEATFRANASGVIQDGFAGDLQGNLWKFDISNENTTNQWDADLHFQAMGPNGETQPITARPTVGSHPNGGSIVLFGTGKYLENADNQVPNPAPVQSFYGIRDYDGVSTPVSRNNLLRHEFIGSGTIGEFSVRATTAGDNFDADVHDGWYIDLDYPDPRGERVVERAQIIGGRVEFVTLTPSDDPCAGGGTSSIVALDAATGSRPNDPVFDLNRDGLFDESETITINGEQVPVSAVDPGRGIIGTPTIVRSPDGGITRVIGGTDVLGGDSLDEIGGPGTAGQRPRSWIQIR